MIKIEVIAIGKIKEKYLKDAISEYSKRLGKYCNLSIIELPDEKTPDNASDIECDKIRDLEGERILSKIKEGAYIIALDIKGKMMDSEAFSQKIEQIATYNSSCIQLIIGGSLGLSEKVLKRATFRLSFSKMTFPHQLMRVILLEQIYRAFRIMKGEPYHK